MEFPSWLILSLAWLFALVLLRKLITIKYNNHKCPPGPKPWPIIGNLNLIGPNPHRSFHMLSIKFGDIMQLKFGSFPIIIASSAEMAKEFLKMHDQSFLSRPANAAGRYTAYNFSDMAWAPYGPYWRQARRIYVNELLSTKQVDSYEYIRIEERRLFISQLYNHVGEPIVVRDHLFHFSLTSICRIALGEKYLSESKSEGSVANLKEFQDMLEEWFSLNGAFNIGDWIPWLSFLDLQGYVKRMKAVHKKFDKFYNYVINDHKARRELAGKNFVPKDIVDLLLQLADDPSLEVKLTSDNIKGLIQDPVAGATDTSTMTVEWAMSELLKHPHLLKKAAEELDSVIGRERWVEERDSPQLPFIDAIVKEAMRLHPVCALLAPHLSIKDCNIAGYHIPKGTTVIVNVWSIGRDSRYWDDPEEFRPERFLGKDIDVGGQNFELLPFGSGRRMCPASKLGLKLVRSTLANLLHGFSWKLPDNIKLEDVSMEEEYGLTTHIKNPIVAVIEPRLPSHMYLSKKIKFVTS